MTKTGSNMKKNLQKQEKASRQSPRCKKTRKSPKSEEIQHSIAARWQLLARQEIRRNKSTQNLSSQHDASYRSTMMLLGAQADEMHKISYKIELNLHIAVRWPYRAAMPC
ncbi:hypothetical protein QL285_034286 [Trifolium repens]|nr:hypothetical protein QL285_034286 [Trifolium repens]